MSENGNVNSEVYACNGCGGPTGFDPKSQNLKCEYCGHTTEIEVEEVEIKSYCLNDGIEECDTNWQEETKVLHCDNCGAGSVLCGTTKAQVCPFCDSSHVRDIAEDAGIKPELMIPFKVSRDDARESFKKWIKGKFFAHNDAKDAKRVDALAGVYVPFWLYDVDTHTQYTGSRGRRVRSRSSRRGNSSRIRWKRVSGEYDKSFRDFPVCASSRISDEDLSEKKLDFNYNELTTYSPAYLAGFTAERYEQDLESAWVKAKKAMEKVIRRGVKRDIGGDKQRIHSMDVNYSEPKYKHVLCPMWVSVFKYQDKEYPFIVNGQTGEVEGKYPLSYPKIAGVVAGVVALISLYYFYV